MSIDEFKTPFLIRMNKGSSWKKLGSTLLWDALANSCCLYMSKGKGEARIVIGVMIIKHKMKLDDREAIETIHENIYKQYFLGLKKYTYKDVFDASQFITLRFRLGTEKIGAMMRLIILISEGKHDATRKYLDDNIPAKP